MDLLCYLPTDDAERYWDDKAQVYTCAGVNIDTLNT